MAKLNEEQPDNSKSTQYVQLAVVVTAVGVGIFLILNYIMPFIWYILSALSILVVAINWRILLKLFNRLVGLYKKNTWLGVGATLGGFLAFTPFVAFLFLKTIWDFRKSDFNPNKKKKDKAKTDDRETIDIDATILDVDIDKELAKYDTKTTNNDDIQSLPPKYKQ
ncbi:MAG: hypothetical protein MK212_17210 [Saprospiraceae bacterium]|nr:hypothetical protein [Saprospiraceae bacterium]